MVLERFFQGYKKLSCMSHMVTFEGSLSSLKVWDATCLKIMNES
jgi:hypothetical protein